MKFFQMPPMVPGMQIWMAIIGEHQFVITHDDGYTASYKRTKDSLRKRVRIDGKWTRFIDAVSACQEALQQMQRPQ
jgi:hypothetical protein